MLDLITPQDDLERCQCRFCGTVFYKTAAHFTNLFCDEECLEAFHKDAIEISKLFSEILKMARENLNSARNGL